MQISHLFDKYTILEFLLLYFENNLNKFALV